MERHIGPLHLDLDDVIPGSFIQQKTTNNKERNEKTLVSNGKPEMLETNTVSIPQSGEIQQTNDEYNQNVAQTSEETDNNENVPDNGQQSVVPCTSS